MPLSTPIDQLADEYEVVVIGSGYGGGIAASRLARAGRQVCLLERGREFGRGDFPNNLPRFLAETQTHLPDKRIGPATGLYDFRVNPDITVFVGCGLGGTSLINSGVSVRPDPRVFEDEVWPAEIRHDRDMERYYGLAEAMLRPALAPEPFSHSRKLAALARSAEHIGAPFARVPIHTNFETFPGNRNPFGAEQSPCVGCGDCESGCNYTAKNTVDKNYLPDAVAHDATIFTELAARFLERHGDGWRVVARREDAAGRGTAVTVGARLVVLAAGSVGSTEILLRSAEAGLPLSPMLGRRFSGNGDQIGISYNCRPVINGVGFGAHRAAGREPVGPCVSGGIDARGGRPLDEGVMLEEGAIPGALALGLPAILAAAAKATGLDTDRGAGDRLRELAQVALSKLLGAYHGATRRTQVYIAVASDDAGGVLVLENNRLRVRWPGVGEQPGYRRASELMLRATEALGGTYIQNPLWNRLTGYNVLTGHPLGGCPMGADAEHGVVDHAGRVFAGDGGAAVYDGLYVMDGAVIPRCLGTNPLLAISALAERSIAHLARERAWTIDYRLPAPAA